MIDLIETIFNNMLSVAMKFRFFVVAFIFCFIAIFYNQIAFDDPQRIKLQLVFVVAVGGLLCFVKSIRSIVCLFVFLLPFQRVIAPLEFAQLLCVPLLIHYLWTIKEGSLIEKRLEGFFLLFFLIAAAFSVWAGLYIPLDGQGIRGSIELLVRDKHYIRSFVIFGPIALLLLTYYLHIHYLRSQEFLGKVIHVYLYTAAVIVGFCLIAFFQGMFWGKMFWPFSYCIMFSQSSVYSAFYQRICGPFMEPSQFVIYLFTVIFLSLGQWFLVRQRRWILISVFASVCALGTLSPTACLGIFLGGFILGFGLWHWVWRPFTKLLIVMTVVCSLLVGYVAFLKIKQSAQVVEVWDAFWTIKKMSLRARYLNYFTVRDMLKNYPFLGVGVGNFVFHSHRYHYYQVWFSDVWGERKATIENLFGMILIESGFIGLFLFVAIWLVLIGKIIRSIQQHSSLDHKLYFLSLLAALLTVCLGLQLFPGWDGHVIFLWAVISLSYDGILPIASAQENSCLSRIEKKNTVS